MRCQASQLTCIHLGYVIRRMAIRDKCLTQFPFHCTSKPHDRINHRFPGRFDYAILYFHAVICFARLADLPPRAVAP
jgi:hypothetical protein